MAVRYSGDAQDHTVSTGLLSMSPITICFWIKIDVDRNSFSTAFCLDAGSTSSPMLLVQTNMDGVSFEIYDTNQGATALFTATVGTWYFVAVSYTSGTSSTNVYYAAAADAGLTLVTSTHIDNDLATTLRLGESVWTGEWLNGSLAAVKFWSGVALSQAEIEKERFQYLPHRTENLFGFWPFTEGGSGAGALQDFSGQAHPLTGGTGSSTADGPPIPWRRGAPKLFLAPGGSTQTISPSSIATTEAFGTTSVVTAQTVSPSAISSGETFGTGVLSQKIADQTWTDHFPGSSLDARWTSSTAASGAITVTDSYAQSSAPADADAALFYYNTKLDKNKSQIWQIAVSHHSSSPNLDILQIWNKATAPAVAGSSTIEPNWRIRVGRTTSGTTGLGFHKYDSSHVRTMWTGHSTNAWQSPSTLAVPEMATDDYYVIGFEIDGPGQRWRLMAWHRDAPSSSFTQDQGLKLCALTDWVLWSSMESTSDLWLVLGEPLSDLQSGTIRYEWVRAAFKNEPTHLYCNGNGPGNDYTRIEHHYSYDGYNFVPEDRTAVAVTVGSSGEWDDSQAKDKTIVKDGDTYYMVYFGRKASTGLIELGLATASSPNGPWTKHGSNPILTSTGAGTAEEFLLAPYLIKDEAETDANKRWKLFYDGVQVSPIKHTIRLATASTPTGTWTKQGICLDVGSAGQIDELGCSNPVVFWGEGQWEVWYAALEAGGGPRWQVCRATTSNLNSLPYTKDSGNNPYIPRDQDSRQALTADLNGRTASMSDTTGFVVDQYISARDSGGGGAAHLQWAYSRIRKVNTNTSLELYHGLSGFVTANSAQVRGMNGGSLTIHHIEYANGRFNFFCTAFDMFRSDATLAGDFSETTVVAYSTNLLDKPKSFDWLNSPTVSQAPWGHRDSAENIAVVRLPILRAMVSAIATAEAFGSPTITQSGAVITPTGVATAEAFGALSVNQTISATGIATAEAFGSPTLATGAVTVSPSSVATAEAFGSPTLTPGAVTVTASGIGTAEAFGSHTITVGALTLSPSSIATAEAFGSPTLTPGAVTITVNGIATAEAFGSHTVSVGAFTITVNGIASAETFGNPTLSVGAVTITVNGIATSEAFGTPTLLTGLNIVPSSIASAEAFGSPTLTPGVVTLSPSAIASAQAFGNATLHLALTVNGIASAEAFGSPTLTQGAVTITVSAIASAEVFGNPIVSAGASFVVAVGIASAEVVGSHTLSAGSVTVSPSSLTSAEVFGSPTLTAGAVTLALTGIATAEAFGNGLVLTGQIITFAGIASAEVFGVHDVILGAPGYPAIIPVSSERMAVKFVDKRSMRVQFINKKTIPLDAEN